MEKDIIGKAEYKILKSQMHAPVEPSLISH